MLEQIDVAIADWEVGPDAVRFNAPSHVRAAAERPAVSPELEATLAVLMAAIAEDFLTQWIRAHRLGRCLFCHPRANPPKLSIDGARYARRQRARRRR